MKKIGSFYNFLILVFISLVLINQSIYALDEKLYLFSRDLKGNDIKTVSLNAPFLLIAQYSLHAQQNLSQNEYPSINNLANLEILKVHHGLDIKFINGKENKTLQTVYTVRSNDLGKLEVGPAVLDSNPHLKSNTIFLEVIQSNPNQSKSKDTEVDIDIAFTKKNVYVNEELPFTMTIKVPKERVVLDEVFTPQSNRIGKVDLDKPKMESKKVNGENFTVITQVGRIYMKVPGKINVSFSAKYRVRKKRKKVDIWDLMFVAQREWREKQAFSNAHEITILPLPYSDKKINGVGKFLKFSAKLDQKKIDKTKAATLTLSVLGTDNVNMDSVTAPEVNIPNELRVYPSKNWIEEITNKSKKYYSKHFEMVVHSDRAGEFTISPQKFTYFDPETEKIEELLTDPLLLKVEDIDNVNSVKKSHNVEANKVSKFDEEKSDGNADLNLTEPEPKDINFENLSTKVHVWPSIPDYIFLILILLPLFIIGFLNRYIFKNYWSSIRNKISPKYSWNKKLNRLKSDILTLEKTGKSEKLYVTLKAGLSKLFTDSGRVLSDSEINISINDSVGSEEFERWKSYYNKLQYASGFSNFSSQFDHFSQKDLFKETLFWIDCLKNSKVKSHKTFNLFLLCTFFGLLYDISANDKSEILDQAFRLKYLKKFGIGLSDQQYTNLKNELKRKAEIVSKDSAIYALEESSYSDKSVLKDLYAKLLGNTPTLFWQLLIIAIWFALAFCFYFKRKKLFLVLLISLMALFPFFLEKIYMERLSESIVRKEETPIFMGPGDDYPKIGNLSFLEEVVILDNKGGWSKVKTEKDSGWVYSEDLIRISRYK